ncbi:hypothetical protein PFICI_04865 [Pestalotiopsis fici W106-1]|uniref:Cysteine dioxygenase n=1 Tax=Pestalotiopsis fici (strain W106-1 / CGMCC3.15140) TaxID=1229662 RepID=W3XAD3_PESFW|nr:uncharacterized protein PFICI_04865 [Pestalotiopsis fici W106-1]ETS82989.1 hypothetical protein PFICI_04865 [Pestalotiopsis fici W106-1]
MSIIASSPLPLLGKLESGHAQKKSYTLSDLIIDIKQHLGSSSGISSSDVDEEHLRKLLQKYQSNCEDWLPFFYNDKSKAYTRNAIENINQKANILLLVWNPGKGSPIHDHANAHCLMKILAGSLTETVYRPCENHASDSRPLEEESARTYGVNEVAYISDQIGLHRVANPSPDHIAVSLHLYTPPNAADYGYHIYNAQTGKPTFVQQAKAHISKD